MTGDQEAPNPGDPDGIGSAFFSLDSSTGRVCVRFPVQRITPATAAHIHLGQPGMAGPVVVNLPAPTGASPRYA